MNQFIPGWYLIYTKPKQENKTAYHLSLMNIEHYLPIIKTMRQWHDRKKIIDQPIFPSYVFVKIQDTKELQYGMEADGACYYIKFGQQLAKVSQMVIDQIKLVVGSGQGISVSTDAFKPGQKVIIKEGGLMGLRAEVVKHNGKKKILVRVQLLNSNLLVDLPSNYLLESAL